MTVVIEYTNGKETGRSRIACPSEAHWYIEYRVEELGLVPTRDMPSVWTQDTPQGTYRVRYEVVSETKVAAMIRVLKRWKYRLGHWLFSDLYDNELGEVKTMISASENLVGLNQTQRVMQMGFLADQARAALMTWTGTPTASIRWIMYHVDEVSRRPDSTKYHMQEIIGHAQKAIEEVKSD